MYPPRCGNQSLSITISSLNYPNTSLNIPHPAPHLDCHPTIPCIHPILPPHPPPPIDHFTVLRSHPFTPLLIHRPAQFPYPLRYRISSSATVPQIQSLILRHHLRDSESCPLLSSPRTRISPSPTVSPSTEIPNLILRRCFREPGSHTYLSFYQHQSRNLKLPTKDSILLSCAHTGISSKKFIIFSSPAPHYTSLHPTKNNSVPDFAPAMRARIWDCSPAPESEGAPGSDTAPLQRRRRISHGGTVPY